MTRFFTTTLLLTSLLQSSLSSASTTKKATPSPVKSTELIQFVGTADEKFLDFAKAKNFEGVIIRPNEVGDGAFLDLYNFRDIKTIAVNQVLCERMLSAIFGPLNKITLKMKSLEIYNSHTGKTCDAQFIDEDKEAKIPERRVIAGFINAIPRALVMKVNAARNKPARTKADSEEAQSNLRQFWATLR